MSLSKFRKLLSFGMALILLFSVAACIPEEQENENIADSKVSSSSTESALDTAEHEEAPIMSSDRVMSKYFDISLFDEENYADIYLGKKFEIDCTYAGKVFEVPTTIQKMNDLGWKFSQGNAYNENSLVFSYETIETTLVNERGTTVKAWFYNSSRSSKKLSECNIVKFLITNDFYTNVKIHEEFHVNGITDSMAITDIIDILGTPSHFYKVSEELYYLDYFITKKDRRNGITIYINPVDDSIVSFEISYYK